MSKRVQVANIVYKVHMARRGPEGGICLAGYSGGGMVAARAAALLLSRGMTISAVIFLSSAKPMRLRQRVGSLVLCCVRRCTRQDAVTATSACLCPL